MSRSLVKRIQQLEKPLSATEKRLVDILMHHPDTAVFESVNKIAAMAQTHGSSLVRLARKLGFSGFPEMRNYLRGSLPQQYRTDDLIRARLSESAGTDILTHLIEREIDVLSTLPQFVKQPQLDAAADHLLSAERILIFAEGTAEALARHAAHRLRRAGRLTLQLSPDSRAVAEGVTILRPGDIALGFSLREPPYLLNVFFSNAREINALTMVISDLSGLTLKPAPNHVLAASRGPDIESSTLTVPMAILNALILTVASRGAPETLASYERYTTTRDDIL
ncbi:MAG: MurR/RpiR family transcriptional regulator [Halomonas sp.]|nr:MurR/RpiR family transcriptional regulator [Halomonas sp.]MBR2514208.1 MurR/RpiR family transcriptional regulator [Halomonas sp.]